MHKKHNEKYLGHSFGSNRSQNLLRFEMYEIIEFWSKLGWNNLFVPQNLRVLLISLRHIMYCFVFHDLYDSPLTLSQEHLVSFPCYIVQLILPFFDILPNIQLQLLLQSYAVNGWNFVRMSVVYLTVVWLYHKLGLDGRAV